jgi:hypothetical protein
VTASFDRVNHDILMGLVAKGVTDKRSAEPQGSPLSRCAGVRPDELI